MLPHHGAKTCCWLLPVLLLAVSACSRNEPQLQPELQAARAAISAGNPEEARGHLQQATSLYPSNLTALVNLALVLQQTGDLQAAIDTLNRAVDLNPADARIWQVYADLLLQRENPQGVLDIIQNIDPSSPAARTFAALADMQLDRPERARHHLERALDMDPNYGPALYNLAVLYRDVLENRIEAQAAFRAFRQAHPAHPFAEQSDDAFLGLPAPLPEPEQQAQPAPEREPVPRPVEQAEPPPEALEPVTQQGGGSAAEPPPTPSAPPSADKLLQQAEAQIGNGDIDAALFTLKRAVQEYPNHPDAVWRLAQFYEQQIQDPVRAAGLYRTFRSFFPSDPRVAQIPETAPSGAQPPPQPGDLAASMRRAMYFEQALEHYNNSEWDKAIAAYRRVLSISPSDVSAAFNLGLAYKAAGDLDGAATAFRMALEQEPDRIKALYMLGLTERDRGQPAEALMLLNRLIRLQPDYAKAHHLLGMIYHQEQRPDMTAIHYERLVELAPASEAGRKARRWLEQYQPPD